MNVPPDPPRLYVSHDADFHWLVALEFGRVGEDQPQECWVPLSATFAYLLDAPDGRVVGFRIEAFDEFDAEAPEIAAIWNDPRFDVPTLGLTNATAGEIAIAARQRFGDEDTLNRKIFGIATAHQGEEALVHWRNCLESGDGMAHFALGYTLMELDRPQESYGHLRHYTEIAPMGAWNWCWYGQAAEALGELAEARRAYGRAIELDDDGSAGAGVDAAGRLAALPDGAERDAAPEGVAGRRTDTAGGGGAPTDLVLDADGSPASLFDSAALVPDVEDDEDPDDDAPSSSIAFDGEDFPVHGLRELDGMDDETAAGIPAGARPKAYAHTDVNEDAVRVLRSEGATVVLVCDGHRGESSARIAAGLLAEILAWDPHALHDDDALLDVLLTTNDRVRAATAEVDQPESRTTLALGVVEGGRVRWVHLGDSLLAIVEPDGEVRRLGKPRHRFLGWPMDRDGVDAAVERGIEHVAPGGWLVVASDGLPDFARPWRDAVRAATQVGEVAGLPLDHPARAAIRPFAIEVVDALIDAAGAGGAGDNVSVAVVGRPPLRTDAAATDDAVGEPDVRDRVRGGLLGLAVGDALGAGIEFDPLERIRRRFGPDGLTDPAPADGRACAITDDTQLALFTAEGILRTCTRDAERGIGGDPLWHIDLAYVRWLRTQGERSRRWVQESGFGSTVGTLLSGDDARRGPGRTCLAALRATVAGTLEAPTNASKGSGVVARSAPIGLSCEDPDAAAEVALGAAVLTHGHPTARWAAAAFATLVAHLRRGQGLAYAMHHAVGLLHEQPGADEVARAPPAPSARAARGPATPELVRSLGEGRVADEALAIGVYCALAARDLEHGLLLAVNHGGGSDTTGAICGAILGTERGASAIPERWLARLEHREATAEIADDLAAAVTGEGFEPHSRRWQERWPAE
jgi:ADP-ribosylglycohydrolase/serine/threonine protein phosphatase PrpC